MGGVNKFRAVKDECEAGHLHASKMEARRCSALTLQQAAGVIADLEQQPSYAVEVNGVPVCKYVADFRYRMADSGLVVVEDCKGVATPVFNLKRKLVEATHPGTVITIWPPKKRKARKKRGEGK